MRLRWQVECRAYWRQVTQLCSTWAGGEGRSPESLYLWVRGRHLGLDSGAGKEAQPSCLRGSYVSLRKSCQEQGPTSINCYWSDSRRGFIVVLFLNLHGRWGWGWDREEFDFALSRMRNSCSNVSLYFFPVPSLCERLLQKYKITHRKHSVATSYYVELTRIMNVKWRGGDSVYWNVTELTPLMKNQFVFHINILLWQRVE